jgi:hypothetical protein
MHVSTFMSCRANSNPQVPLQVGATTLSMRRQLHGGFYASEVLSTPHMRGITAVKAAAIDPG